MGGRSTVNSPGTNTGMPHIFNIPSARSEGAVARDAEGTVWIYGKNLVAPKSLSQVALEFSKPMRNKVRQIHTILIGHSNLG